MYYTLGLCILKNMHYREGTKIRNTKNVWVEKATEESRLVQKNSNCLWVILLSRDFSDLKGCLRLLYRFWEQPIFCGNVKIEVILFETQLEHKKIGNTPAWCLARYYVNVIKSIKVCDGPRKINPLKGLIFVILTGVERDHEKTLMMLKHSTLRSYACFNAFQAICTNIKLLFKWVLWMKFLNRYFKQNDVWYIKKR